MQKKNLRFILLGVIVFVIIGLNELGYGAFSLLLLIPAGFIMSSFFPKDS